MAEVTAPRTAAHDVRTARVRAGLSLDELSRRAQVGKGALVGGEKARGNPDPAALVRLADAFDVSVSALVQNPPEGRVRVVSAGAAVDRARSTPAAPPGRGRGNRQRRLRPDTPGRPRHRAHRRSRADRHLRRRRPPHPPRRGHRNLPPDHDGPPAHPDPRGVHRGRRATAVGLSPHGHRAGTGPNRGRGGPEASGTAGVAPPVLRRSAAAAGAAGAGRIRRAGRMRPGGVSAGGTRWPR
ncbi:helix-turn-helix domain-containing protein [Thermobifida halotolerans]|nr:helix-turn-helix transcriptional regulator [Thermobifida halotolerans]